MGEIRELESQYGDGIKAAFTVNMIYGINDKKKIRYMPPVELLSQDLYKEGVWEDRTKTKGVLDQSQFPADKLIAVARKVCK